MGTTNSCWCDLWQKNVAVRRAHRDIFFSAFRSGGLILLKAKGAADKLAVPLRWDVLRLLIECFAFGVFDGVGEAKFFCFIGGE